MKKIIIISILSFILTSCDEEVKNKNILENNNSNISENETMETKNYLKKFFAQIDAKDFKKEIENPETILIDVRTPWELIKFWKIRENQILIDINNPSFVDNISKLDKTKKYLIYCWHGNRSVLARDYMQKEWFSYVKDLKGGIVGWEDAWENLLK